ncbi:MAG: hypothetical protein JO348_08110 [Alphaproteobacteria bacterium]|nr:hypothetical protein [Alphaproteobacteria bacterium]MBV9542126.1 hypothetical protein [Alphaproteobacteria bacterium]MBV9903554.1 hypothetical protein [Alphaproteobacteria bacterium]
MPRYYFHIRDAMGTIDDTEGLELATLDAAEAEAQRSAESIAEQRKYMPTRCQVVVADEEHVVIAVVPVPR